MDAPPPDWRPEPLRPATPDASCYINAAGVRWRVQVAGKGPTLLLLHGAGASSHSWADCIEFLTPSFRVIAPDLPGQGCSSEGPLAVYSMRGMARATAGMLRRLGVQPDLVVGHSAGAAVGARMIIDRHISPRALIGVNAALRPFGGRLGGLASGLARFLSLNPVAPRLFAWRAGWPGAVERLIEETGSRLSSERIAYYRTLATNPSHVAATLKMMANWDLPELERDLPKLQLPVLFLIGERDRTVPPTPARILAQDLPNARVINLPALGHLAHEEAPQLISDHIIAIARQCGVLPGDTT